MPEKLRILILEDNPADADLMVRTLERGKLKFSSERVETKKDFIKKLREFSPDIILADYKVPSFGAMDALKIVEKETSIIPFIIVTGAVGEEEAAECMKKGAWDYLLKMNLIRLVPAIESAIKKKKEIEEKIEAEKALEEMNLQWSATFNSIEDGVCLLDLDRKILKCNKSAGLLIGQNQDKLIGKICCEVIHGKKTPIAECPVERMIKSGKREEEELLIDGKWFSVTADPVKDEKGKGVGVVHTMRDITERKNTLKEVLRAKDFSEKVIDSLPGVFYMIDPKGKMLKWNKNIEEVTGYSSKEVARMNALDFFVKEDKPKVIGKIIEVFQKGESSVEADIMTNAGKRLSYYFTGVDLKVDSVQYLVGMGTDITEQKESRKKLMENERFLQNVFDGIQDGLSILDKDLNIVRTNKWMEELYQASMPLCGKKCYSAYQKRDSICPWCPSVKALQTGEKEVIEVPYPYASEKGERGWILLSAFPLKDSNGNIVGIIEHVRDITEHKKTEEEARSLQEYLQLQVERMPIGLVVWGTDFRAKAWNPAAAKIFGFSEKEAIGKHPYDLIVPEKVRHHTDAIWQRLLEGDESARSINENTTKDGRTIICDWVNTPLKKEDGTVIGILAMVQDVTERKEYEDKIARFQTFADQAGQGFGMASLEGKIVYSNQVLCDFLKMGSPDRLIGTSVFDYYSGEWLEKMKNNILPAVLKTGKWTGEIPLITAGKKELQTIQSIFLMRDDEGNPKFFANVLTDISDRKKAEVDLQRTIDELQNYKEVTVGRELQMMELKKVINELSKELGKPEPYDLSFLEQEDRNDQNIQE